jgi:hypothetical protein
MESRILEFVSASSQGRLLWPAAAREYIGYNNTTQVSSYLVGHEFFLRRFPLLKERDRAKGNRISYGGIFLIVKKHMLSKSRRFVPLQQFITIYHEILAFD